MYSPCYTHKMTKEEYEMFLEGWKKRRAAEKRRRAASSDIEAHIVNTIDKIHKAAWRRKHR